MVRRVEKIDDLVQVKNILISVANKNGLPGLIQGIRNYAPNARMISTGGTYNAIRELLGAEEKQQIIPIQEYTGNPETEGGLVKTLSRAVSLGLLTETYCEAHLRDLEKEGVTPIDVVICNMYPFHEVANKEGTDIEDARSNIDVGGSTMIRSSAKNFHRCVSLVDPADYGKLICHLQTHKGSTNLEFRYNLMPKAFATSAAYDAAIAWHFHGIPFGEAVTGCYKKIHNPSPELGQRELN